MLQRSHERLYRVNSPLQALTLLNDPVFFDAAKSMSKRVLTETDADPERTIVQIVRWSLGRSPRDDEKAVLLTYFQQQLAELAQQPETVAKLVPEPVAAGRRVEQAAWTNTASVVLNLHEFITRD